MEEHTTVSSLARGGGRCSQERDKGTTYFMQQVARGFNEKQTDKAEASLYGKGLDRLGQGGKKEKMHALHQKQSKQKNGGEKGKVEIIGEGRMKNGQGLME